MTWLRFLILSCLMVAIVGCGSGSTAVKPPEVTPKEKIKAFLEDLAQTGGGGGSAMGAIMQECAELEKTEPALAVEVREELQKLMAGGTSDQIKEKAKELLTKF